ncbi:pyridoxamine 5'-phosphate oxidase [Mycobacterium tuberculosis 02_1987]|nr:pyridoxamine 5'-phosphate oxidase [Mycobacterium tuberculosis 02_1987]
MGEFDPKLRFAQSPVARLATSTPDGTPHLVPVVFALGARPRRPVQTLSTPPSTRSGKRRSGCAGSPISSTIHGPACSSTAMPMIGPSCGGSGPTGSPRFIAMAR